MRAHLVVSYVPGYRFGHRWHFVPPVTGMHLAALVPPEHEVAFLSILTPLRGTPVCDQLLAEGRLLTERDWPAFNGYNVAFVPRRMSPAALQTAHRRLWRSAFAPTRVARRLGRAARRLSPGGAMLAAAMNGFYGLKRLGGNLPADAVDSTAEPIRNRPYGTGLPMAVDEARPRKRRESDAVTP